MLLTIRRALLQKGSVVFLGQLKTRGACGAFRVAPASVEKRQQCPVRRVSVREARRAVRLVDDRIRSLRPRRVPGLRSEKKTLGKEFFWKRRKRPHAIDFASNLDDRNEGIMTEQGPDTREDAVQTVQLTPDQQKVLQLALDGVSLFIAGHAGTGKSFLLLHLIKAFETKGLCLAVTATTGMAALRLNGNTFHSTFGVPVLSDNEKDALELSSAPHLWYDPESLSSLDVIIIDEISLLHAGYIEALDLAARTAPGRARHMPFGGIQVILSGDFLQLMHNSLGPENRSERLFCRGVGAKGAAPAGEENSEVKGDVFAKGSGDLKRGTHLNSEGALFSVRSRRRMLSSYCQRPVYESPVFQHCLLHLQLFEPARQREDPLYFEDLEKLRRGILSYRLSRSATLNKEDPNAIRLFSTKRAVSAFNASKMLELDGEERCFRTELQVVSPSGPRSCAWKSRGGRGGVCTDGLIIHFCSKSMCSTKWRRRAEELVRQLCSQCKLTDVVRIIIPPVPLKYLYHLSVYVQFTGLTRDGAARAMGALRSAIGGKFLKNSKEAAAARKLWGTVACEVRQGEYLERLLRPFLERRYAKMIQNDHVLQHKRLKVGCRVMLLRNLNKTYVNGSLGTIVGFRSLRNVRDLLPTNLKLPLSPKTYASLSKDHNHLKDTYMLPRVVEDIDGAVNDGDGEIVPVVRMDLDDKEVAIPWLSLPLHCKPCDDFFEIRVIAMPLTPAYAYTVHKVQGLTFDHPVLFDGSDFFSCDHLIYVAASRVRRFSQFRMINVTPRMVSVHRGALRFTSNIPSVVEAARRWGKWKRGRRADIGLYRATWKERRCGAGKVK